MHKLLAAYDLGASVVMFRYSARYLEKFPWHPESRDGMFIALSRLRDALTILPPKNHNAALEAHRLVDDLTRSVLERLDKLSSRSSNGLALPLTGVAEGRRTWNLLAARCKGAVADSLAFRPWEQFGRAVARCFIALLDENLTSLTPHFSRLRDSAQQLPISQLKRSTELHQLVLALAGATFGDIPEDPNAADNCDGETRGNAGLGVEFLFRMRDLDRLIRLSLGQISDPIDIQVNIDQPDHSHISLNGVSFQVDYYPALIMSLLTLECGKEKPLSAERMKQLDTRLAHIERIDREVDKLPPALKKIVGRRNGHNGGFWLRDLE